MSIVRGGQVVWSYTHGGRGEISDAVLEPNGNILFAHQFGITEITLDKTVVWNFDAPAQTEIHTAQPIGTNSVWFIQNGNPAKFMVIDKTTGKIEHQFFFIAFFLYPLGQFSGGYHEPPWSLDLLGLLLLVLCNTAPFG